MADKFANHGDVVEAPATLAIAVTPHNSNPLTDVPKALYVGVGGDIVMVGSSNTSAANTTFKNVPSGAILPFRAYYIRATGTTATDILALY